VGVHNIVVRATCERRRWKHWERLQLDMVGYIRGSGRVGSYIVWVTLDTQCALNVSLHFRSLHLMNC